MLYDFIDGTLACRNAENAVASCLQFINKATGDSTKGTGANEKNPTPMELKPDEEILDTYPILFIKDYHPANHSSFKEFGGTWPAHCVEGTRGSEIHIDLQPYVKEELVFYKGRDPQQEQYSGFEGTNEAGQSLNEVLELLDIRKLYICGIATEYCVKNTVLDLFKEGYNISVVSDALAYIDPEGHKETLNELAAKGVEITNK